MLYVSVCVSVVFGVKKSRNYLNDDLVGLSAAHHHSPKKCAHFFEISYFILTLKAAALFALFGI